MIVAALVLPRVIVGITEASATRRPSTPCTRSCGSTTGPDRAGRGRVVDGLAGAARPGHDVLVGVGGRHAERLADHRRERRLARRSRARCRVPASMLARSSSVVRKLHSTTGLESGRGVRRRTKPRLVGLMITGPKRRRGRAARSAPRRRTATARSGTARRAPRGPARVRMKAAPSGMFEVSGPRPCAEQLEVLGRQRAEQRRLVGEVVEVRHAVVLEVLADRQVDAHLDAERRAGARRDRSRRASAAPATGRRRRERITSRSARTSISSSSRDDLDADARGRRRTGSACSARA